MLLCLSRGSYRIFLMSFVGFWTGMVIGLELLGYGQDREGPLGWRASSYEVTCQQVRVGPGTAGESFEGQRRRQPISGSGRPRELVLAGGRAQVVVYLAGDVTLEAADDFLL